MEKPPSSKRTGPAAREFDIRELRAFAKGEGVSLESLVEAIEEPTDLSIVEAFIRAGKDQRVCVDGRFELIEQVGQGSFGRVFLARDRELGRKVAVKIMPLVRDPSGPEFTEREGQMLAALEHPNVVRIYDHGRGEDYRYLVLEWLEGETLFLGVFGRTQAEVLACFLEAGGGLAAVHRRGLVHRDFKANNVMLDGEGRAVLVDFGLARSVDALRDHESEYLCGAITHLAPERFMGDPGSAQSDQFAFCVSLWESLTGVDPFLADSPSPPADVDGRAQYIVERLKALANGPSAGREFIPKRLRAALERGLRPNPADRWPSMEALLEALAEPPRRRWGRWLVGVLVAAFVIMSVALLALRSAPAPQVGRLPRLELPGATEMLEGTIGVAKHQPHAGHEAWSAGMYQMSVEYPRAAAWSSMLFAWMLEREGSPLGQTLSVWVTGSAARRFEMGESWEAATWARHLAATRADAVGESDMAAKQRRCAQANVLGKPCN